MDETEALAFAELVQCPLDIWVMVADGVFGFHRVTPALERMRPGFDASRPMRMIYSYGQPAGHYDAVAPLDRSDEGGELAAAEAARRLEPGPRRQTVEEFF